MNYRRVRSFEINISMFFPLSDYKFLKGDGSELSHNELITLWESTPPEAHRELLILEYQDQKGIGIEKLPVRAKDWLYKTIKEF